VKKKLIELVEGDEDPMCGGPIKTLVMKGEGFIVYLSTEHGICWSTDEDYEDFSEKFGLISNRVKTLENLGSKFFKGEELKNFNYLLAQGFARVLDDKSNDNADQILNEVEKSLEEQGKQSLKTNYIIASFVSTLIIGFLIILTWIFRNEVTLIIDRSAFEILMASYCGGIGAFISSFIRALNFHSDIRVLKTTYILDGFLRIFYGLVAGFLISLGIKSNILLGLINDIDEKTLLIICFFSTIAGASEKFIPSIIKKVEDKV
jgi:hypothetical protein